LSIKLSPCVNGIGITNTIRILASHGYVGIWDERNIIFDF